MSANRRHAEFVIHAGPSSAVRTVGLEARDAAAVAEVRRRATAAGQRILDDRPSLACIASSVTFATTEGHVFEVHTAMPEDRSRRFHGPGVQPNCLDHLNFAATDPVLFAAEMEASRGFILSERTSGHEFTWRRAADGRHHTIAAVKGKSGVHHISWEFAAFQDFKALADNLSIEERPIVWGPGRHGAGDNLFLRQAS